MGNEVDFQASDMRQGQIRYKSSVIGSHILIMLAPLLHRDLCGRSHVVMAEHAPLGVSSSATSVNQGRARSWLYPVDLLLDHLCFYFSAKLHKVFPQEDATVLNITGQLSLGPNDDSFNPWEFRKVNCESL